MSKNTHTDNCTRYPSGLTTPAARGSQRVTRLNIDSRYRNRVPRNILSADSYSLPSNPLLFTTGSTTVTIQVPNHNLHINDRIVLENVQAYQVTLQGSSLELIQDSTYARINFANHGFVDDLNYPTYVRIDGVRSTDGSTFLSNVPLNLFNRKFRVRLGRDAEPANPDYFYIDTGITAVNSLAHTGPPFTLSILSIHGISLDQLNANYPINVLRTRGHHIVTNIGDNFVQFEVDTPATSSTTVTVNGTTTLFDGTYVDGTAVVDYSGGNAVSIAKVQDVIEGFPSANYYKMNLRKTFYNVNKIRLVSTEIPNTEKAVKSVPVDSQNNMLYWQLLLDGDYTYSIALTSGNYDSTSLAQELVSKIQAVERVGQSTYSSQLTTTSVTSYINRFHSASVVINNATNIFSLQMFNEAVLDGPITPSSNTFTDGYSRITVTHPRHFLKAGDTVVISNASTTHTIPNTVINGTHTIESVVNDDVYEIRLPIYNRSSNVDQTSGGNAVSIKSPIDVRLMFDRPNTIGKILGFRNVGSSYAVTPFTKLITNQVQYEDDTILNSVGAIDTQENLLNFSGESYILMTSPIFTNAVNTGGVDGIFAKLQLAGQPGTILYNHFVQITEDTTEVIPSLSEMEFRFVTPDGSLFNFNNIDHSFTLELYEKLT